MRKDFETLDQPQPPGPFQPEVSTTSADTDRDIRSTCTAIIQSSFAGTTSTAVTESDALTRRIASPLPSFNAEFIEIPIFSIPPRISARDRASCSPNPPANNTE